ncbi:MAG TPA: glycosyltransferase [Hyphomicrobiaceae bacterium]|nr:glycosyltransferase [Hyphomicrobiaceae bacterium]
MRVFFYVQNLLGIGHIVRALRISRALTADGFDVELVLGGRPVPGLDTGGLKVIQLAPVSAGPGGFGDLVGADGRSLEESGKRARRNALLSAFIGAQPDIVLVESYPFGRRQMRFELEPLLAAIGSMRPPPLLVSSIRDILQEHGKPGRSEEVVATLRRHFDHVIVHGDPAFVRLAATFPLAAAIADMTSYSGMVGPVVATGGDVPVSRCDVVISAGGGAVGRRLLTAAIAARPRTSLAGARWLAVTGTHLADRDSAAVNELAARYGVEVARFLPDLVSVLAGARVSISQAGYNSVADILRARVRAVLVPFAAAGETEQSKRASLLAERGLAVHVSEADLDAEAIADAVERALALDPSASCIDLNGAPNTAAILRRLLSERTGAEV